MNRSLSPTRLLCILTGLNVLNYLDRYIMGSVRTPIAAEFGLSYGQSGQLFTAFMLGFFITCPLFGYLGDRSSRKVLIGIGVFVWSLGTVLTGLARGFSELLLYRALVGVGEASFVALTPGIISDAFPRAKRNNALTLFYVAIPVGAALGFVLGGQMSAHWSWHYAFFWAGAPGLIFALILFPLREPGRGESDHLGATPLPKPGFKDMLRLFRSKDYNLIVWGYVAYTFAIGALSFWGPTFFQHIHGLSVGAAGNFFGALLIVGGVAGTLAGGFLATWWQKRTPAGYAWMLTTSVAIGAPLLVAAIVVKGTFLSMALFASSVFLLLFITAPANTATLEAAPVNLRSSAIAICIFMIHLFGDLYSPEMVGRLADRMGKDLRAGMLILPAALIVAVLLWGWSGVRTVRERNATKLKQG